MQAMFSQQAAKSRRGATIGRTLSNSTVQYVAIPCMGLVLLCLQFRLAPRVEATTSPTSSNSANLGLLVAGHGAIISNRNRKL